MLQSKCRYNRIVLLLSSIACLMVLSCTSSSAIAEERINAILSRGDAFMQQGSYQESESLFVDGLEQFPTSFQLHYNLGIVYALQGDFSKSLVTLQHLNELSGAMNVKYLKALGGVALVAEAFDIAVEAWEQVVTLDPLDNETRLRLIELLVETEQYEQGYTQALTAYELGQYSKELFTHLSVLEVLVQKGDGVGWDLIAQTY